MRDNQNMIAWAMERVHRRGFAKDPPPTNNKQAGDGRTDDPASRPLYVVRDGEQAGARKRRRRSLAGQRARHDVSAVPDGRIRECAGDLAAATAVTRPS